MEVGLGVEGDDFGGGIVWWIEIGYWKMMKKIKKKNMVACEGA